MIIHDFYYNEDGKMLYVEFSTIEDGDNFYRVINILLEDAQYYSPNIITEDDIDEELISEILIGYFEDNDLPEPLNL